jgi:hypothetical protein
MRLSTRVKIDQRVHQRIMELLERAVREVELLEPINGYVAQLALRQAIEAPTV